MPKYQAGDTVRVANQDWVLGSWPENDEGPFTAKFYMPDGGEVQSTMWAGQVQVRDEDDGHDLEPTFGSSTVELVTAGDGVQSIAGEVPEVEPEPSLTEDSAAEAAK